MRAVVQDRYGPPDVLRVEDIARAVSRRVLNPKATLVIVGAPKGRLLHREVQQGGDGRSWVDLLAARTVVPVIDRRYELAATADAFRYLGDGHARGEIVLAI